MVMVMGMALKTVPAASSITHPQHKRVLILMATASGGMVKPPVFHRRLLH
jgi:hypothetical protein